MKFKTILVGLSFLSFNVLAQINLTDDSVTLKTENVTNGNLTQEKFKELNGFSKYSGTIQGFSGYCNFSEEFQRDFYNDFVKKVKSVNLTKEESDIINQSFTQSAYEVKKNGINGLSCDKFKNDFEKIIAEIKK